MHCVLEREKRALVGVFGEVRFRGGEGRFFVAGESIFVGGERTLFVGERNAFFVGL
jgi:hypothetical protein